MEESCSDGYDDDDNSLILILLPWWQRLVREPSGLFCVDFFSAVSLICIHWLAAELVWCCCLLTMLLSLVLWL